MFRLIAQIDAKSTTKDSTVYTSEGVCGGVYKIQSRLNDVSLEGIKWVGIEINSSCKKAYRLGLRRKGCIAVIVSAPLEHEKTLDGGPNPFTLLPKHLVQNNGVIPVMGRMFSIV